MRHQWFDTVVRRKKVKTKINENENKTDGGFKFFELQRNLSDITFPVSTFHFLSLK